jgi:short-subunit dehydrogenase
MTRKFSAVITGASSGIGSAIAIALASMGGSVWLVGRDTERLQAVAKIARASAQSVCTYCVDLTVDAAVLELGERIRQEFRTFDVLVHCAAALYTGTIAETPVQQFDALYRTNVRAPFLLTKNLLPLLKSAQGQIVFVNSSQGLQATARNGAYASTKHALKAIADSLRHEINSDGIRVLSVYPGRTATAGQRALTEFEGRTYRPELLLQPEDVALVIVNALQLPRTAELTNIEVRPLLKSY